MTADAGGGTETAAGILEEEVAEFLLDIFDVASGSFPKGESLGRKVYDASFELKPIFPALARGNSELRPRIPGLPIQVM